MFLLFLLYLGSTGEPTSRVLSYFLVLLSTVVVFSRILLRRGCIFAAQGLFWAAQGLDLAAQGLYLATLGLRLAAQDPYLAIHGL